MDGVDVMPLLMGDSTFRRGKDFYYFAGPNLQAIRSGEWKLRISPFVGKGNPKNEELTPELYNLITDPSERINLAEDYPQVVADLKEKMINFKIKGRRVGFQ